MAEKNGFCEAEVNPLGPFHAYEAPPTVLAVSDKLFPEHTGVLLLATGAEGIALTVTEVVPAAPVHPETVAVTE